MDCFPKYSLKWSIIFGIIPETCSADAAYHDYETLAFIEDNDIKALIANVRTSKLRNGHGSNKIFPKDNTKFDYENNVLKCYANQPMYYQDTVFKVNKKTGKLEVQSKYYNE